MKNKLLLLACMAFLSLTTLKAQLNVGSTDAPFTSAVLQATSTSRGFLMPRMTADNMNSIIDPIEALMIYCTNCSPIGLRFYINGAWTDVGAMAVVSSPQNTVYSSISGTAIAGGGAQTITAVLGTWVGTLPITYSYQWQQSTDNGVSFTDLSGQTAGNYTIPPGKDVTSNSFRVKINAVNNIGTTNSFTPTVFVSNSNAAPIVNTPPVITGATYVDQIVTTSNGLWTANANGLSYTYQWFSNGMAISGAINNTFKITYLQEGTPMTCVVTAINGFGGANSTTAAYHNWSPKDYGLTNLKLWLDGGDDRTLSFAGGKLANWIDKSGNSLNFAQATSNLRPTVVNHRIIFDGVGTFMQGGGPAFNNVAFTGGVTYGINCTMNTYGGYVRIFDFGNNLTPDDVADLLIVTRQSAAYEAHVRLSSPNQGQVSAISTTNATDGVNSSLSLVINPGAEQTLQTATLYKDGYGGSSGQMFIPATIARNTSLLGKSSYAHDLGMLSGNISEVLIWNTTLADADRFKMEGYLAWKWGTVASLPANHLYKNTAPQP